MILPMKKICLAVQDQHQDEALLKLREIGIVHLDKQAPSSNDRLSRVLERMARAETAMGLIEPYKTPKKKKLPEMRGGRERRAKLAIGERRGRRITDKTGVEEAEPYSLDAVNAPERPELINLMVDMDKNRKTLEDRHTFLGRERGRVENWGNFDPAQAKEIINAGIPLFFYELTKEAFKNIPAEIRYIKINEDKITVRVITVYDPIPLAEAFRLPEESLVEIDAELADLKIKRDELETRIKSFADRRPTLKKDIAFIQNDLDFEYARADLEKVTGVPDNYGFSLLRGYVPAEDMGKLKAAAAENGWALTAYDPGPEDPVPTKLKNNKFVRLLEPLTSFLDVTPGYRETDVSVMFLVSFTIFYAMIFGDAGYGMLVTLAVLAGIFKTMKTGVPQILKLFLLLGVANVVWGVLTCSWFGIDLKHVPQALKDISLSYISEAKSDKTMVDRNLQLLCFSLGLIHLTIAHIKRISTNFKTLRILADIGTLGILWGMYNLVLVLVVGGFPMLDAAIGLIAGGFVLYFIFNSYQGSIAKSILASCQNFIGVVLSLTGAFADIMSYIRLWAVGLAGAAIASTINDMAGPLLGGFAILGGMVLLAFGHGLNFALSAMGVLVHGVRLNTLEFSSHVGLAWSGTRYKPFVIKQ